MCNSTHLTPSPASAIVVCKHVLLDLHQSVWLWPISVKRSPSGDDGAGPDVRVGGVRWKAGGSHLRTVGKSTRSLLRDFGKRLCSVNVSLTV